MRFIWTNTLESTQMFLQDYIKNHHNETTPLVVATKTQTHGKGSRGNSWQGVECGLYLSCALHTYLLPKDLPKQSASIYFGFLFLEIFRQLNREIWLKWPNDFYLQDSKVGGLITQYNNEYIIFGVGLNIFSKNYAALFQDTNYKEIKLQNSFFQEVSNATWFCQSYLQQNYKQNWILYALLYKILYFLNFNIIEFDFQTNINYEEYSNICTIFLNPHQSWCIIFQKYQQEFYKNYKFSAHAQGIPYAIPLENARLQHDGSILLQNRIFYSLR